MKKNLLKILFIFALCMMPVHGYALDLQEMVAYIEQSSDEQFLLSMISMARSLPPITEQDVETLRKAGASQTIIDALIKRSQELNPTLAEPEKITENQESSANSEESSATNEGTTNVGNNSPKTSENQGSPVHSEESTATNEGTTNVGNNSPKTTENQGNSQISRETDADNTTILSTPGTIDYLSQVQAAQASNLAALLQDFYQIAKQNYEINSEIHRKFSELREGHEQEQAANSELPRIQKLIAIARTKPQDALQQCLLIAEQSQPTPNSAADVAIQRCLGLAMYELQLYSLAAPRLDAVIQNDIKSDDFEEIFTKFKTASRIANYISPSPDIWKKNLDDVPKALRNDYIYTTAYAFLNGSSANPELARQMFLNIAGDKGLSHLKALYLIASYQVDPSQNKFKSAARNLEKVIEDTENSKDPDAIRLNHLATLLLARIAFENSDFAGASRLYLRIPPESHQFRKAMLENAWACLFNQDYQKALAFTHTLYSPTYADDYLPDLHLIEAMAFLKLCHYDEALDALDAFKQDYITARDNLQKFTALTPSREYYSQIVQKAKNPEVSLLPKKIYRALLANHDFYEIHHTLAQISKEKNILRSLATPQFTQLQKLADELENHLSDVQNKSGLTISRIFSDLEADISALDITATEISIEIKLALRERDELCLKRAAQGKSCEFKTSSGETSSAATKTNMQSWKFLGEYWRDELIHYVSSVPNACQIPED